MIVRLTNKEIETIEKTSREVELKYKEAKERARSLRPDPEPIYEGVKLEEYWKVYKEWEDSGPEEWKIAHAEELALYSKSSTFANEVLKAADNRLLERITKSQDTTIKELKKQIDIFCKSMFVDKETDPNGEQAKKELLKILYKPLRTLDVSNLEKLINYADKKIATAPEKPDYIIKYGITISQKDNDEYAICYLAQVLQNNSITAEPLSKKTVLIPRVMEIIFNGQKNLERDYNQPFTDPDNRYNVAIYKTDPQYKIRVAIDYRAIINEQMVTLPALSRMSRHIYNAICSFWLQGNYTPSYRQLWRATTGNMSRSIVYGKKQKFEIEKALLSYKANLAYSTETIVEVGKNDKRVAQIEKHGGMFQLLHYDTRFDIINGQQTDILILDPNRRPLLLELAQVLNNEYMTDNISFFDVSGLEANEDNLDLKDYIFVRIKKMKNPGNNIKQKKISIATLIEDLNICPLDKKNPKDRVKKSRLTDRIVKILDNAKSTGFIEDYSANKRKGSTEIISFTIDLHKKKSYT